MLAWREGNFGRFMSSVLALRVGGYSARLLDMHSDFGCVSPRRLCATKLVSSLKAVWIRNNFIKLLFSLPLIQALFSKLSTLTADSFTGQKRGKKNSFGVEF